MKKRSKTTERKKLVKELDRVFSLFIRGRDKQCVICKSRQNLQCGHLFSRVAHSTRWSEKNCHGQCRNCNLRHEYDAYPFNSWFIRKYGRDEWDFLHHKFSSPSKYKNWELEEMIEKYKKLNTNS